MKKISILIMWFSLLLLVATCKKDNNQELGTLPDKSTIKYSVTQDKAKDPGGNTVILNNETPGTVSIWDYGTGHSTKMTDTIHFAFTGTYIIRFSVVTGAGIVKCDSVPITVTQDNLNYVNDPLWIALTDGPGKEKTWLLDTDGKFFSGPIYFYDPNNYASLWWAPGPADVYPNNMTRGDYGYMSFNLIGGANFHAVKLMEGGVEENSTFSMNTAERKLTINGGATILRGYKPAKNGITGISNWSTYVILTLDDNSMQLGVLRDHDVDGEGLALITYNFISKDYSDNWTPPQTGDPNFDFGNQGQILAVSSSKSWKFDLQVPYNWTDLNGKFLNDWNSRNDIVATGWAPYGDGDTANIMNVRINFAVDKSVVITYNDKSTQKGTYTIDETKNLITFKDVTPNIPIAGGWVSATTTADNQWKIVKVEKAVLTNEVIGIWLGKRDPVKSEYMVYHFVKS